MLTPPRMKALDLQLFVGEGSEAINLSEEVVLVTKEEVTGMVHNSTDSITGTKRKEGH